MKQLFAIVFTVIILLQSFSKLIILADYEMNKDYIARVLCENRNKPTMHCNGHCQLKKQLDKDENRQSPSNPLKEKNDVQYFLNQNSLFDLFSNSFVSERSPFNISCNSSRHLLAVFHPPAV